MKKSLHVVAVVTSILTLPGVAAAQHAPYAGMQMRPVKALSDQQFADLKAGRGMGLALAAELNGYPGPVHVLELSKELSLTAQQRAQVENLFAEMKREAVPLSERLILTSHQVARYSELRGYTQSAQPDHTTHPH